MKKPKYYVSKITGNKYAFGNSDRLCKFPIGTKLYINSETKVGALYPLPIKEYPYTIEYDGEIRKSIS
jgi:hypothetical protein